MLASSFNEYMWAQFLARTFHTSIQKVWVIQTITGIVLTVVIVIVYLLISIKRRQ